MITPAGAQHSETMEGSAEEATSGDPDDSPSVFGLTEYDGAPAESVAAHDEPPKLADKASSRPTKGPRKLADKVAPTAANPEVMELNQAMLAEQEARDRLQRLKAMAQRHIVSAAARSAVAARRVQKRQQGIDARRDRDERLGRTFTQNLVEVPKASEEEVQQLSELFNKRYACAFGTEATLPTTPLPVCQPRFRIRS